MILLTLSLTFYEIKNKNKTKFEAEQVLQLENDLAMIIVNWLYRNDEAKLTGNYLKIAQVYHKIDEDTFEYIQNNLKRVLEAPLDEKDVYALFYFPCLTHIDNWESNVEMFSTYYYDNLTYLFNQITEILNKKDKNNSTEREFFYNISW